MDPITLVMLAVLALLIFFMFRNSRKRQKDQATLQSKVVVGAKVMTNFGVYGTILSIDEEENEVLLESTPGTVLAVHRQTVARVVTPVEDEATDTTAAASSTPELNTDNAEFVGEPEFGERATDAADADVDGTDKKND